MQAQNDEQGPTLILLNTPDEEARAAAADALYQYNVEQTGVADRTPIGAKLLEPVTGKVLGGLWGRTELGLLFLDMFFLAQAVRGHSQRGRLLSLVEEEARRRGCRRAVVETSSFQAPEFYKRHGYEEFGRVEFGLAEHTRVFLRKNLDE